MGLFITHYVQILDVTRLCSLGVLATLGDIYTRLGGFEMGCKQEISVVGPLLIGWGWTSSIPRYLLAPISWLSLKETFSLSLVPCLQVLTTRVWILVPMVVILSVLGSSALFFFFFLFLSSTCAHHLFEEFTSFRKPPWNHPFAFHSPRLYSLSDYILIGLSRRADFTKTLYRL